MEPATFDGRTSAAVENRKRVEEFMRRNLCATQRECAKSLKLALMTVNRHVRDIRAEWRGRG